MSTTPIWPIEGVALDSTGDMVADSLADKVTDLLGAVNILVDVYPTLVVGATVTTAAVPWTEGNYFPIVAAGPIASPFHIHGISVETCTAAAGVFELSLYAGVGHTEVARVRFPVVGGFFGTIVDLTTGIRIAAGSQIDAKLASSTGVADSITMSIRYALEV